MDQRISGIYSVTNISVVHLVRKKNGIGPFCRFLASYLDNPAGIGHDLIILYKGFYRKADIAPYEELLGDIPHSFWFVADFGFDLRPYFLAAEKHNSKYFCFLNSFSVILDKDWLLKFYRHITQPGVGLVGATGSWGSISSGAQTRKYSIYERLVRFVLRKWRAIYFDPFPNYHLRTNSFMIARETMLKIRRGVILTKMQAYRFESGKISITKQVEQMGLRPVVVGKNGKGYGKHEWDVSNTFWRGTQDNLLISDNQTRKYDTADLEWKRKWELFAWGRLANEPKSNVVNN